MTHKLQNIKEQINDLLSNLRFLNLESLNLSTGSAKEVLNDICGKIKKTSELDMERQVHDIIIRNVDYIVKDSKECHTAKGILKNHHGVCDGISKLAEAIFHRIGMESRVVEGILCMEGKVQGPHAWNIVRVDGVWYHLDITEDLVLSPDKMHYRYDYFNLSDKEIEVDHQIKKAPHRCDVSNRCYYLMNGLYCYTLEEFEIKWSKAVEARQDYLAVRLPEMDHMDLVIDAIVDAAIDIGIEDRSKCKVSYSYNEDQHILDIMIVR